MGLITPRGQLESLSTATVGRGYRHTDAGRALERNTSPLPIPSQAGRNWLQTPSSTLPPLCQRSPFGQQAEGQSQVSTSAVSLAPEGSSRLGRRLPCAWHPARGAGSGGPAGSGTPPAICHPAAEFQLATLRPQPGAPNGFLAKTAGKVSELCLFGLGLPHLTVKGIHVSFPISTSSLSSTPCSSFSFSATSVPERGAAKSAGVPTQLMCLFCFFSFIICIPAAYEGLRQDEGLFPLVLPPWPLNQ